MAQPPSTDAPRNIIVSGTNFWNPGDDFVRDGVIHLWRDLFPGAPLNFLFYNFNADFFPLSKFHGISNFAAEGDIDRLGDAVDAILIAGLSAGDEIKDLYQWILSNHLEDRVFLIGAGYENNYVARHCATEPEASIFRNARIIIGRTAKVPAFFRNAGLTYCHLPCPALFSAAATKAVLPAQNIERIGFSIQLPESDGIVNHTCAHSHFELAVQALIALSKEFAVELVAHHKSEFFFFTDRLKPFDIPVRFSSFYTDLHAVYSRFDLVVTTRLHAGIFANSHGIPAIIINDTDRHSHAIDSFDHAHLASDLKDLDNAMVKVHSKSLAQIAQELGRFKTRVRQSYLDLLRPIAKSRASERPARQPSEACARESTSAASPGAPETAPACPPPELPVHFVTIVLDGMPFIEHHIAVFNQLPFPWHWHIVEGVAELAHDTAWSKANGGRIPPHRSGLSVDGTSEYLDRIRREFPGHVSIYRKPHEGFWDGKIEMVNAPLDRIRSEALLWQLDADELWTAAQIETARELFLRRPEKTAAFYRCHYFVGPDLVVTSRDTYGNHSEYEWLRTWRFTPGCRWESHEPPCLTRPSASGGAPVDLARIDAFTHDETEAAGLVFQHFAYATEAQARFKEVYYGYNGAAGHWARLQQNRHWPAPLARFFSWVTDAAAVDTCAAAGILPLADIRTNGTCSFLDLPKAAAKSRVLVVRTDSIGDSVLAAGMLPFIRRKHPGSEVAILCRSHVSELWLANPYVDSVICFDWQEASKNAAYFESIAAEIRTFAPDIVLNTLFSREPLTERLLLEGASKAELTGFDGDLANISAAEKKAFDLRYSRLIPADISPKLELARHREFLEALGAPAPELRAVVWTFPAVEQLAAAFFRENKLDPARTLAVFPGAQQPHRVYPHFAAALAPLDGCDFIFFGGAELTPLAEKIARALRGRSFILTGQTTLIEMAALMRRCRLYAGNDSAGAHIACAVGIPNVVVYGGGQFGRFFPYSHLTTAVVLPLDCSPCNWHCKFATAHCVHDVDPALVTTAILDALRAPGTAPRILAQERFNSPSGLPRLRNLKRPAAACAPSQVTRSNTAPSAPHLSGKTPLVSALVSTFNAERFMAGCLEDLENQSVAADLEIIVIDSGSSQNERAIVERFQGRFGNIRYLRTERESLYAAWNRALSMARGKFLTSANTDDRHSPFAFEKLAALLEGQSRGLAYANSLITRFENETFDSNRAHAVLTWPEFSLRQLLSFSIFGPHPLWRRDAHRQAGLFDPSFKIAGDYEFFIRLALRFGAAHSDEALGLYFEGGLESQNPENARAETRRALAHHRQTVTLEQLYPALADDPGDKPARAAAALDWSNSLLGGLYPALALAQHWLGRAGDILPNHPAILNNAAVIECLNGNTGAAMRAFARLSDALPQAALNAAQLNAPRQNAKPALVLAAIEHPVVVALPKLVPPSETRSPLPHAPKRVPGTSASASPVSPAPTPVPLPSPMEAATAPSPSAPISFCIITAGQRPALLAMVIASIRAQQLPAFEIIVAGECAAPDPGVIFIASPKAAAECRRGALRQAALERARFDLVMFLDDDCILSRDWSRNLEHAPDRWDILTFQIRLPDGTRYWDHATHGGKTGHRILEASEHDPNVYATSGAFLARRAVFQHVQWDLQAVQFEDLEFSRCCRQHGCLIAHCHDALVFHADPAYSSVGRTVHRRSHPSQRWCLELHDAEPATLLRLASDACGVNAADAADLLRFGLSRVPCDPDLKRALEWLEQLHGGPLSDNRWFPEEDPHFLQTVAELGGNSRAPIPPLPSLSTPVRWLAPFYNPSGYASEAINFVLSLHPSARVGISHHTNIHSTRFADGLPSSDRDALAQMAGAFSSIRSGIVVSHNPAPGFLTLPDASYSIGRTMFETDRLPAHWVGACNRMDELWVPSAFNVETFAHSGVDRDKLVVIPGAVNEHLFNPATAEPFHLDQRAAFNFLAVFEWSRRKGWDVLLAAYLREFSAEDDVCLHLRTYPMSQPDGDSTHEIWNLIREFAASLGLGNKPWPRIHLIPHQIPSAHLPGLYLAADCLVAPSRGEGWGRPQHEAMMMGVPVIGTRWSATTEFMTEESAFLLEFDLAPCTRLEPEILHYRGHQWAEPSEAHLRQLMRTLATNPGLARAKGASARRHVHARFTRQAVGQVVLSRLVEIERRILSPSLPAALMRESAPIPAPSKSSLTLAWQGPFESIASLDHVNRSLSAALEKRLHVHRAPSGGAVPASPRHSRKVSPPRITLRHSWPPDWKRPDNGLLVVMQPWEFGALPQDWVQATAGADQIWAYSSFVRNIYVGSGIDPDKIRVVPLGIDPGLFHPNATPLPLPTAKTFRFLFVGGTLHRKGADLLLRAYLETFTRSDDVVLVVKDFGAGSVYAGQTLTEEIRRAQSDPNAPEILLLEDPIPAASMPGLFTACHCLVHPYRGEGFALPVLESLACGLGAIVTGGGATDDFATDEFALRLPSRRIFIGPRVNGMPLVKNGWLLEPDFDSLTKAMRHAASNPVEIAERGSRASLFVREHWTWEHSASVAAAHLEQLCAAHESQARAIATRRARKCPPISLPPVAHVGSLRAAEQAFSRGNFEQARIDASEALRVRPFHPEAHLLLARIHQHFKRYDAAADAVRDALRLTPNWKPARKFLRSLPASHHSQPAAASPNSAPPSPPSLTACLITRNEEEFLPRCLESIRGLAGQIVVVDTGSTDATIQIARSFGAEVHSMPWQDDFSLARNAALEHATGDWILVLDADEELAPGQSSILEQHLADAAVLAYRLPIIDSGRELEGGSYVPRLFRNVPGAFYIGRIHEQVFPSLEAFRSEWQLENQLGTLRLLHHGYRPEIVRARHKTARNLWLLDQAVEEFPNEPHLLMNLGLELCKAGQVSLGLEQYAEAFEVMSLLPKTQVVPELRETLLTQLASRLLETKQHEIVIRVLTSALARSASLSASLHFSLGLAYLHTQQHAPAAEQMRLCLKARHNPALAPLHKEVLRAGPHHCLALSLAAQNDHEAASESFQAALRDDPESVPALFDFARFLASREQPLEAMRHLNRAVAVSPSQSKLWRFGAELALKDPAWLSFACDWTAEAIRHCPNDAVLAGRYAESLLLTGHPQDALPFWQRAVNPSPDTLSAILLCELTTGQTPASNLNGSEAAVSRAFIQWYRRLIAAETKPVLAQIERRAPDLARILPTAAQILQTAWDQVAV